MACPSDLTEFMPTRARNGQPLSFSYAANGHGGGSGIRPMGGADILLSHSDGFELILIERREHPTEAQGVERDHADATQLTEYLINAHSSGRIGSADSRSPEEAI